MVVFCCCFPSNMAFIFVPCAISRDVAIFSSVTVTRVVLLPLPRPYRLFLCRVAEGRSYGRIKVVRPLKSISLRRLYSGKKKTTKKLKGQCSNNLNILLLPFISLFKKVHVIGLASFNILFVNFFEDSLPTYDSKGEV